MSQISALWSLEGMLVDKNRDGVVDGVSLFIDLPEGLLPEGLIDFCARAGFETTALSFTFFEEAGQKVTMSFVHSEETTTATFLDGKLVLTYKNEHELSSLLRELAFGEFDLTDKKVGCFYTDVESLSDIWSFSGFGQHTEASPTRTLSLQITVEEQMMTTLLLKELCNFAARTALHSTEIQHALTGQDAAHIQFMVESGEQSVLTLEEKNRIRLAGTKTDVPNALRTLAESNHWSEGGAFGHWEQHVIDDKPESPLLIEENWSDEGEIERVIRAMHSSANLEHADVEVYLSEPREIREQLAVQLKSDYPAMNSIRVRSSFKTGFHWIQEELVSKLTEDIRELVIEVQKEERAQALELPIRWIQEIYPIDRYIEETSALRAEDVTFTLKNELESTYAVYGKLQNNVKKLLGKLQVPVSKMNYVDGEHVVYPSTSAVRIIRHGEVIEEQIIETDRAQFYRYYTEEILPKLRKSVELYNEGQGHIRPLFDRIELDVWMSEEEQKLPVDEERISSLEALHEDLYFNTLDYFAQMGIEVEGKPFNAPGGIHPYMHVRVGEKPEARIRIYQWNDKHTVDVTTSSVTFTEDGAFDLASMNMDNKVICKRIERFNFPTKHIHEEVNMWLNEQKSYKIVYPAHSYNGHAIPVIECYEPTGELFESTLKMTLMKKTIFIEAGHHANEISSIPAVLELVDNLDLQFKDFYKEMNVVVIPLANPDGYKLVKELMYEHPKWKHHAARYNAVGLEFAHIRFQKTMFGEANVYPEILRKWAPDIIVDDHGIPAHEWVQPFAGYNSPPRFPVSYFLPSAKIYGIGRTSPEVNQLLHQCNLEKIVSNVSGLIKDTKIAVENDYWQQRFIKYGNQWLPEIFPIEEVEGIHFYTETTVTPTYKSVGIMRYPEWVAADIISEAADEIVNGEALLDCINAHKVFDLAIIDTLFQAQIQIERAGLKMSRQRPIQL
ncbi:MAG TPA: M14 family metallopeptidase [Sporosarcina psychrophila]|uniref:M14 family metallopeptidase n=1 Tax=Sporosarcina psychrophila TaxID=1476 RepID=A0A921FYQ3_SPOPS|nr:M14 family metallopeptidase [Sporosarcina psychrophila]